MKDVLISGATGLVGSQLTRMLADKDIRVRSLSRSAPASPARDEAQPRFRWDGIDPGREAVAGCEAVVHLAGEPIFGGLPTNARRVRIRDSRIDSTRAIVRRIEELDAVDRPRTFVCASAVGCYGDRGEEPLTEDSALGDGFLAEVCRDWEAEAERVEALGVRVVQVRIGVVLAKDGGALSLMRIPFSLGVGGRLGSGRQFFPWIHLDDLVGVLVWALENEAIRGPVNAVAPQIVRNSELTKALGRVLRRPTILPVPSFALKIALGDLAGELLGSRNVQPKLLIKHAFQFRYPDLDSALEAELA